MKHQGGTIRNLIVALVATALLLAVSALGQDSEVVLHTFTGRSDGALGGYHLVSDSAGNLYGTTLGGGNNSTGCEVFTDVVGCGIVFELSPTGTETVLHVFTGGEDGGVPLGGVVLDSAGNLYGTTLFGGDKKPEVCHAVGIYAAGCGVVYRLAPTRRGSWKYPVLYTFTGGTDGSEPWGNLILDAAGNLYGTTTIGGNDNCATDPTYGCGVVFMLTPGAGGPWTESVLYPFSGGSYRGDPYGALTFDSQGNLYGTTQFGGDNSCFSPYGCGVVFQLAPTPSAPWTEAVLHAFTGAPDGALPFNTGVTLDASGNVYGTTISGGDTTRYYCRRGDPDGCGVVFELAQGTWAETVLHAFTEGKDGGGAWAPVIFDSSGNLYSVTENGGKRNPSCTTVLGCGVLFQMPPADEGPRTESVLYSFTGGTDGRGTDTNLLFDSAGNLYGMTYDGGDDSCNPPYGCGVVFEVQQSQNGSPKEPR